MKKLNKRARLLLAIAGIVIIVVAAGLVLLGQGGDLFGTAALVITPSNPTLVAGNSTGLSVNAVYKCAWSSSNTAIVSLVNYSGETKSVTVKGNAAGSATITARCGLGLMNVNSVSTHVTVQAPPPPGPAILVNPGISVKSTTIGRGYGMKVCSEDLLTQWSIASANPADAVTLDPQGFNYQFGEEVGNCTMVAGNHDGTATIRATNGAGGSSTVGVRVSYPLTMIPRYRTFTPVGGAATVAMAGANSSSTWSVLWSGIPLLVGGSTNIHLSSTTGQSVTVTATIPGCAVIACTNPSYGTGLTSLCFY